MKNVPTVLRHITCLSAATALVQLFGIMNALAEEFVLSSWLPPQHPIVSKVIEPWAKDVAAATEGRVTIRILPRPAGPPPAHFDLAADGVADITYGLHSFTTDDRFLRSRIGQFSFLGDDAEKTSVAYWNVYSGPLKAQEEHKGTKLLSLWVHGPGMFHNNKKAIEKPEDFAGLKIRVPGGYIAELTEKLGATTQFMGPGEVFEKLSTGVIDGVTFPAEALKAFKLSQHLKYSMTVPGGFYNTSWFLVMNEGRWGGVSEADRVAIEKLSGPALAATAGKVWNVADAGGLEDAKANNITIQAAPEPVLAKVHEIAAEKEGEWSSAVAKQGMDGAAALVEMRKQAAQ